MDDFVKFEEDPILSQIIERLKKLESGLDDINHKIEIIVTRLEKLHEINKYNMDTMLQRIFNAHIRSRNIINFIPDERLNRLD